MSILSCQNAFKIIQNVQKNYGFGERRHPLAGPMKVSPCLKSCVGHLSPAAGQYYFKKFLTDSHSSCPDPSHDDVHPGGGRRNGDESEEYSFKDAADSSGSIPM